MKQNRGALHTLSPQSGTRLARKRMRNKDLCSLSTHRLHSSQVLFQQHRMRNNAQPPGMLPAAG